MPLPDGPMSHLIGQPPWGSMKVPLRVVCSSFRDSLVDHFSVTETDLIITCHLFSYSNCKHLLSIVLLMLLLLLLLWLLLYIIHVIYYVK